MCKYAHLIIGEKVTYNVEGYCLNCKTDMNFSGQASYLGHTFDNGMFQDKFWMEQGYPCPGCGLLKTIILEPCGDEESLTWTVEQLGEPILIEQWPIPQESEVENVQNP